MRSARGLLKRARETEFGGLARDTVYVAVSQGAVALAALAQIALITHNLGVTQYGRLAVVVAFVTLVTQFFDVRVGIATMALGARKLEGDLRGAAGVFQLSYLIDLGAGLVGFAVVVALAPVVGPQLVEDGGVELVLLYALVPLAGTLDHSSLAILKLLDRFSLVALLTVLVEVARVGLIVAALAMVGTLAAVVVALAIATLLNGAVIAAAAARAFHRTSGLWLRHRALGRVPAHERREMLRMVFQTNVVSYGRIAQVQLPTLLLGLLAGATTAGVYKVGMAGAAALGKLADPLSSALLPRFARLLSRARTEELARLIKQISLVAVPVMTVVFILVVLFRDPILEVLGDLEPGSEAGAVLILGALAQGLNGALFWNSNLLYAAKRAGAVSMVFVAAAVLQIAGVLVLVPGMGATGAALAFLASYVLMNVLWTTMALRMLWSWRTGVPMPDPARA